MIKICKIFGDFVPREFSVGQGLLQTSRHFENRRGEGPGDEVEVRPKPIVARACTFSRALCRLRVITLSFDKFTGFSLSILIGQSNYFGFGFTTLD